jgi:ubiquinone/menaquinone biosynthesis C-methylase UbiE
VKKSANIGIRRFRGSGKTIYERLKFDVKLRKTFYDYMDAYSQFVIPSLLRNVDFSKDRKVLDVGGGSGIVSVSLAKEYPMLSLTLFDLPQTRSMVAEKVKKSGMTKCIVFKAGNIFKDDFPDKQDAVLFIHQLVIWSQKENQALLEKSYKCLNKNGRVIILSSISEDSEDGPLMAALDTVYFRAVAAGNGMVYPWKDYEKLLREVGFKKIDCIRCNLWTPHGIIIGYK